MPELDAPPIGHSQTVAAPHPAVNLRGLGNHVFLKWFALVNAGVLLTTVFWMGSLSLAFPIVGTGGAFLALLLSRWLARRAHQISIIDPQKFNSDRERALHGIVAELAGRAGLPVTPAVGIYHSADMNAFATGPSQSRSMVAFSSALLEALPENELRAVAAHEIAHIACRDMLVMVLLQGVVNTIVLAATVPIAVINWVTNQGDSYSWLLDMTLRLTRVFAAVVLAFLGSLAVKAFSRRREYRADALAAQLVGPAPMAAALRRVSEDHTPIPSRQMAYAALKFSGRPALLEWFSTHPAMEKRIAALESLENTAQTATVARDTQGEQT